MKKILIFLVTALLIFCSCAKPTDNNKDEKLELHSEEEANNVLNKLSKDYTVESIEKKERSILKKEEMARIQGYSTNVVDSEFKVRITNLVNKVRAL